MKCHRCNGLMVVDHLIDMEDDSGHLWLRGWHCINCGAVEDPEIYGRRLIRSSWRNQPAGLFAQKRVRKSRMVVRLDI
jgi:hypothetical protein